MNQNYSKFLKQTCTIIKLVFSNTEEFEGSSIEEPEESNAKESIGKYNAPNNLKY